MVYSVKWIKDNLGINRKVIKNYEREGLLSAMEYRNPRNNYREFSREDVERIWFYKCLQGMGFTVKEIKAMSEDEEFDFREALTEKIKNMEEELKEIEVYINYAKTIKYTGAIPCVKEVGSITYKDFIKKAHENWNFFDYPELALMDTVRKLAEEPRDPALTEKFLNHYETFLSDLEKVMYIGTTGGYLNVISALSYMDYRSEPVQTVVRLYYDCLVENCPEEYRGKAAPEKLAYILPLYVEGGEQYLNYKRIYGENGVKFIGDAFAYFSGYDSIDEYINR